MLDLKVVRQHRQEVAANIVRRKSTADLDLILSLDDRRLALLQELETYRAELKSGSKSKPSPDQVVQLRQLGEQIQQLEGQLREVESQLHEAASYAPNMSSPAMPEGQGENDNVEVRVWIAGHGLVDSHKLGKTEELKYRGLLPVSGEQHHLDLGQRLGIIDMGQAAKISGSRFAYLLDGAARLENAVIQLLSTKLLQHDFIWVDPPLLVREPVLFGTSHFPEGRDQVYEISAEHVENSQPLFLVGSSEPPLFAYGQDRVFTADQLPLKMFAVTPCFRSEVGSWGRDVRGIKRVHQFTKLEMDVIAQPDQSMNIFEELLGYNQWMLEQLGLSYRVLNKCTGDCGYLATYFQYDVEVWMPSQQEFMEVMTDTHATDYQARRLNIRFMDDQGQRQLAHTVNDTGAALSRIVAAILDNYQQPDGTVMIPDVLQPWMGTDRLVPNKLASLTSKG